MQPRPSAAPFDSPGTRSPYRADVDGLRAAAIALVLLFHAFPRAVPGGFVGVDIFFVISGYLISGILLRDIATGAFSLRRFYARRIRRIFPALAAMLLVTTIAGWLFLLPDEWRQFGRQLFAGAAFIGNLGLMDGGGYFDWEAHTKPLLHLWSLGIEEQFYFVWPVVLILLSRLRRSGEAALLLALSLSFALNVATVERYPVHCFYLPFTRMWELGLGSWLAWREAHGKQVLPERGIRNDFASVAGLVLCFMPGFTLGPNDTFPGYWALAPTTGSVLLIAAGPSALVNRRILSSTPAVGLGLISYPLYLWHWPLLVAARLRYAGDIPAGATVLCIVAAIALSIATYKYLEHPIRAAPINTPALKVNSLVIVLVGAIGAMAARDAISARLDLPHVRRILDGSREWEYPFGSNFGRKGDFVAGSISGEEPGAILFVGDSHLEHFWPRLELLAHRQSNRQLRFATNGGCPPVNDLAPRRRSVCNAFLDFALTQSNDPAVAVVVFGADWNGYVEPGTAETARALSSFTATIAHLTTAGKTVYVVLPSPSTPAFDPRAMVSRADGSIHPPPPVDVRRFRSREVVEAVREAAVRGGARTLDPLTSLCPDGWCRGFSVPRGPHYRDDSHLRPWYAQQAATFLDVVIERSETTR